MAKFKKGESGNPTGRPPGATNRVPSTKEITDDFKRGNKAALRKLLELLTNGPPELQLKAAVKIVDINYQLILEEEKENKPSKNKPGPTKGEPEATVSSDGKGGKVIRIGKK